MAEEKSVWSLHAGGMQLAQKRGTKKMPLCVDGWDSSESEKGREKQKEGGGKRPLCQI